MWLRSALVPVRWLAMDAASVRQRVMNATVCNHKDSKGVFGFDQTSDAKWSKQNTSCVGQRSLARIHAQRRCDVNEAVWRLMKGAD